MCHHIPSPCPNQRSLSVDTPADRNVSDFTWLRWTEELWQGKNLEKPFVVWHRIWTPSLKEEQEMLHVVLWRLYSRNHSTFERALVDGLWWIQTQTYVTGPWVTFGLTPTLCDDCEKLSLLLLWSSMSFVCQQQKKKVCLIKDSSQNRNTWSIISLSPTEEKRWVPVL